MAPEMLRKKKCDGMTLTVWQLGLVLWEMVYGDLPFEGAETIKKGEFPVYDDVEVTEGFEDLVYSCLNQDPKKRPTLEKILSHEFLSEPWYVGA